MVHKGEEFSICFLKEIYLTIFHVSSEFTGKLEPPYKSGLYLPPENTLVIWQMNVVKRGLSFLFQLHLCL